MAEKTRIPNYGGHLRLDPGGGAEGLGGVQVMARSCGAVPFAPSLRRFFEDPREKTLSSMQAQRVRWKRAVNAVSGE